MSNDTYIQRQSLNRRTNIRQAPVYVHLLTWSSTLDIHKYIDMVQLDTHVGMTLLRTSIGMDFIERIPIDTI